MEKSKKDKIRERKNNKGHQSYTGLAATRCRADSAITLIALVITIALNCYRSGRKRECAA